MRSLIAFTKKEWLEQRRTGKITFLLILFVLLGIMNPAVAKLTPWMLELMADSLAESGMIITDVPVSAMESWVQFFKNIPMALIAFVLLQSSLFTREYQTGTLVLSLTKGLRRYQVVLAKSSVLVLLWTVGYWLCFGITWGYNAYYWDNAVAQNLLFSAGCWWIFGIWVMGLMVLFSAVFSANTGMLIGTGAVVAASGLLGLIPKFGKYLPTMLCDGNALIYGTAKPESYGCALLVAGLMCIASFAASIPCLNQKQL